MLKNRLIKTDKKNQLSTMIIKKLTMKKKEKKREKIIKFN